MSVSTRSHKLKPSLQEDSTCIAKEVPKFEYQSSFNNHNQGDSLLNLFEKRIESMDRNSTFHNYHHGGNNDNINNTNQGPKETLEERAN